MKLLKLLFLTVFMFTGMLTQTYAQDAVSDKETTRIQSDEGSENYALLIRNFNHLRASVKTIHMLTDDDPKAVDNFEVVMCGREVENFRDQKPLIKKAQKSGIVITACGMSMDKFSVNKDDLPDGVGVVPNGLIRIFELQEKGYQTITL